MTETNWAGNYRYGAQRILRPTSLEELRDVVTAPGPVRVLGSRHTFNDLADTTGTLVDLAGLPGQITAAGDGAVRVPAAVRYGDLAIELHRRGLALGNLASLPHICVAGAVATGTHGSGDGLGSLATGVRALTILTADGTTRVLRRGDADFAGAVVSLGALGVVTSLELDVEPTYDLTQTVFDAPTWEGVLATYDRVSAMGASVSIFTTWRDLDRADQLWVKARTDRPAPADADLITRLGAQSAQAARHPIITADPVAATEQMGVPGPWHERLPHFRLDFTPSAGEEIQSEYLLPRADLAPAIGAVARLSGRIAPMLHVMEIRSVKADDLWLSGAYGRDTVGIHFTWRRDQAAVDALLPAIEAALPPAARPHWGKAFTLGGADLARRYPKWNEFRGLRDRFDPQRKFYNAYLCRVGL